MRWPPSRLSIMARTEGRGVERHCDYIARSEFLQPTQTKYRLTVSERMAGDGVTALVNHTGIILPKAGDRISDRIWSVMQESCRYGFSDLR